MRLHHYQENKRVNKNRNDAMSQEGL